MVLVDDGAATTTASLATAARARVGLIISTYQIGGSHHVDGAVAAGAATAAPLEGGIRCAGGVVGDNGRSCYG